jgi:hypothetical protein
VVDFFLVDVFFFVAAGAGDAFGDDMMASGGGRG